MRVGVVTFPGTVDDKDVARALSFAGIDSVTIRHSETTVGEVDALILPGGTSYGDYLRPGALAKIAPITGAIVEKANSGMPILGIGNGFQILLEAGLLPGALTVNPSLTFVRADVKVRVTRTDTAWTSSFAVDEQAVLPVRNTHGAYYASPETLQQLESEGLIVMRYESGFDSGSVGDIAGISNPSGTIVGLMPHPEFAVEPGFGPDTSERMRAGVSGLKVFTSLLAR